MKLTEQFRTALYRFRDYPRLVYVTKGATFGYVSLLMALCALIATICFVAPFYSKGGLKTFFDSNMPDFKLTEKGKLNMSEKIDYYDETAGIKILVDTDTEVEKEKTNLPSQVLADSDTLYVKNGTDETAITMGQLYKVLLSLGVKATGDAEGNFMDKTGVSAFLDSGKLKSFINILTFFSFIFILTVGYIVNVVFTACVGNVINTFTKGERIPFGKILKISFYCNTFSAVFGAFTLSYGGLLISSFLGSIYMFFAVRNIKEAAIQSL